MAVGIDTEKLNAQIKNLEKVKTDLQSLFQNVKTDTTKIKEDWDSNGATVVYEEFDRFDVAAEDYMKKLETCIDYLNSVVNQNYIDYENKENELIDDRIATN